MAKVLGRRVSLGVAKEAVRGTASLATYWVPWVSFKNDEKIGMSKLDAGYGTIHKIFDGNVTKLWAEHEISAPITDKAFGIFLLGLFGNVNSVSQIAPNALAYDHTFTVAETVTHQSISLSTNDDVNDFTFANGMIDEFSINFELGKILEFQTKMISKKGVTGTLTVSNTTENFFRPQDFSFKYATLTSGLAGASTTTVRNFKINFKKNLAIDWNLGTTDPTDINNGTFEVTGEFTQVYEATTLPTIVLAGTKEAMEIKLTNASVTIATSANPTLTFTLNQVVFDDMTKEMPLGDLVLRTYKFEATYKIADSKAIQAVLTNLVASY